MMKLWRSVLVGLALGSATLGSMVAVQAATALVRIRVVNVGFILGAGGGTGALSLHGRVYPFSVGGIGVGTFGASAAEPLISEFSLDGSDWESQTRARKALGLLASSESIGALVEAIHSPRLEPSLS